jgi:hypothetical protein
MNSYCQEIISHDVSVWSSNPTLKRLNEGPISELPTFFAVLEFAPTHARSAWTYASWAMAQEEDPNALERHLLLTCQTSLTWSCSPPSAIIIAWAAR